MKKKLFIFVPIFMCTLLIVTAITPTIAMSENISEKVFRLHILANSDSKVDQKLKLQVRDEILNKTQNLFINCKTLEDAINLCNENMDLITTTAENVIYSNGFSYKIKAYVDKEYFDTRDYENFSLPAGVYECLKIEIGQAKGHNWWCVMYPAVCISGCVDDFNTTLTDDEKSLITNNDYKIKFKIVEIYEKIKYNIIKD